MTLRYLFTVIFCFVINLPAATAADSFSKLFIFGDSLSDNGNLAALPDFDFLNQPPYENAFSNGRPAVEVLAEKLDLSADPSLFLVGLNAGTNYSVAGARARGNEVIDLRSQIGAFLSDVGFAAPDDALYVVFIGGNDVRDARDERHLSDVIDILEEAVEAIDEAIRTLVASGAKSILVVNSPDVADAPETAAISQNLGVKKFVFLTKLKTRFFNRRLARSVAKIEKELDVDLVDFDLFSFFGSVIRNGSALGFSNTTEGCFSSVTFTFNLGCENGANFDKFVFFDEFHPTARTNERTGRAFSALVPEPMTAP